MRRTFAVLRRSRAAMSPSWRVTKSPPMRSFAVSGAVRSVSVTSVSGTVAVGFSRMIRAAVSGARRRRSMSACSCTGLSGALRRSGATRCPAWQTERTGATRSVSAPSAQRAASTIVRARSSRRRVAPYHGKMHPSYSFSFCFIWARARSQRSKKRVASSASTKYSCGSNFSTKSSSSRRM